MFKGIIYKYTFPNGKVYIGQTNHPNSRMAQHLSEKWGPRNVAFWRAYKKYGSFEYEEIEHLEEDTAEELREKLNHLEQKYIKDYDSTSPEHGYNLTTGGDVFIVNEEGRRHMSEARTDKLPVLQYDLDGNFITEHASIVDAAKAVGSRAGTVWNCCLGIASGKKLKKVQKVKGYTFRFKSDYPNIPKHIDLTITDLKKPVLQFTKNGEFIREWESIISAQDGLGVHESGVRQCCYGRYKQSSGFIWRFKDSFNEIPTKIEPIKKREPKPFPELTDEQIDKRKRKQKALYGKHVYQYSFDGTFIQSFPSISDAAISVGGDSATITNACKCINLKSAYGFQWRFGSEVKDTSINIGLYKIETGPKKAILQYTRDGKYVQEWSCARDFAEHYKVSRNMVYLVLSGRRNSVNGYILKYK